MISIRSISGTPQVVSGNLSGVASANFAMPGNVVAGNLLVIVLRKLISDVATDLPIAADVTKASGSATIGTVTLDKAEDNNYDAGNGYVIVGILSVPVTGSGSLTLQIATGTSQYCRVTIAELLNADVSGSRVAATSAADNGFSPGTTSVQSGNVTLPAAGIIIGGLCVTGSTQTLTEDGAFTLIDENESNSNNQGAAIYRASSSGITDSADWTIGAALPGVAAAVAYKEAVAGVSVTSVTPSNPYNGQTGVVIVGTGFGASQGSGKVYISPTDSVADGSKVEQTVTAWGDNSITITATKGGLSFDTNAYLFVVENGGSSNASGKVVQIAARPVVREVLIDKNGVAVASLTGATMLVWRAVPTTGAPNPNEAFTVTTDGTGHLVQVVSRGSLANGDPVWIAVLKDGSPAKGTLRKVTPSYE